MSATISTLDAILKEFYLGPIEEQLNNEVMVIELFEKATVDWQGKNVIIPIHVSRNTGVGFKAETADFATAGITPGQQGYERLVVTAKFLYGRLSLQVQPLLPQRLVLIHSQHTLTLKLTNLL